MLEGKTRKAPFFRDQSGKITVCAKISHKKHNQEDIDKQTLLHISINTTISMIL